MTAPGSSLMSCPRPRRGLHRDRTRFDPLRSVVPSRVLRVVVAVPRQLHGPPRRDPRARLPLHQPLARRSSRRTVPHRPRRQGRDRHPAGLPDR
jgi:hypothetical protein